uniref:EF-hand domain-containing protein n=1 Tax=Macrostomum lignano TaxID=282301 RepID=A0A1I8J7E5_9PLAT
MLHRFVVALLPLLLLLPLLVASSESPSEDATASNDEGHLKPFGQQGPLHPIDSVDGFIPPEEFLTNYVQANRPLLFRGGAKVSPAFEKWTDAYLSENTPPRPAGDVFIEHNKKENRSQRYSFIHFKKFLSIYNTSDIYMVSEVPSFLLKDLVVPFPLQCKYFVQGGLDTHVAWFSSGGTSSVIHYDDYENVNCLLRGRKTLVFLNTTRYASQVNSIIDKDDRGYSSADSDAVHQVRSFDNNLAVNLWWTKRDSYDTSGCGKIIDPDLRFSRVLFAARLKAARDDAYSIRQALASNLKLPVTQLEFLDFLSRGDTQSLSSSFPDFPPAAAALFQSLDVNKDGALTEEEFKGKMKLKTGREIKAAATAYNVQVFAMHEAADEKDVSRLPKLLATSDSGEEVFTPERTWLTEEQRKSIEVAEKSSKDEL